jgi:hypothetical protein
VPEGVDSVVSAARCGQLMGMGCGGVGTGWKASRGRWLPARRLTRPPTRTRHRPAAKHRHLRHRGALGDSEFDHESGELGQQGEHDGASHSSSSVNATVTGSTWSAGGIDATGLNDGTITYTATATDAAGNSATTSKTTGQDTVGPIITGTFPQANGDYNNNTSWDAGAASTLAGTSSDASGVPKNEVSVQQGAGNCFQWGDATHFSQTCPNYQAATGTTNWMQAFPSGSFPGDGAYTLVIQATDNGRSAVMTRSRCRMLPTARGYR